MLYSKSTGGFYDTAVHGVSVPSDAVEIPDSLYQSLFSAQASGQVIQAGANGLPVAVTPTVLAPTVEQQIVALERQQTPRRLREAAIGTDNGWLKNLDAEISALRAKLPQASSS